MICVCGKEVEGASTFSAHTSCPYIYLIIQHCRSRNVFLPSLASQFFPIQGALHEHENVCFLSSATQEPPLRQPRDVGF